MTGCFVAVVGPSGAGKDSLIGGARDRLTGDDRFRFVRRTITRAEGGNERHDTLDPSEFPAAVARGDFVLHWGAHGLHYGIPRSATEDVGAGRVVVANLSRRALDEGRAIFPRFQVVNVTAPAEVLARRLAGRGRESEADIRERLAGADLDVAGRDVTTLVNDGTVDDAVTRFVALLETLAGGRPAVL